MDKTKDSYSNAYKEAGVDVTAGYESIRLFKDKVRSTYVPGVLGDIGGFGGLFEPNFAGMKRPVTVSGTDGVGTKIKIAFALDRHDTIGIDCVAMCVNDIICSGAAPMFFLDYIACGKNIPEKIAAIVSGVADGCRMAGCALIGGETAEHPGLMPDDEYDLAGFSVGIVDYDKIIDGSAVRPGDVIIGIASSGVHSNGFSLVRRVLGDTPEALSVRVPELSGTIGETLLTPTRIYVKPMLALQRALTVKAVSHITGGGFYENIPRMLPDGCKAVIERSQVPVPPIFDLIARTGGISAHDLFNTFNMGIGMAFVVSKDDADRALELLSGFDEQAWVIGEIAEGDGVELV
ncbi:MAG: phosphoribosylformylglycinamidine cyclo-ligase [Eubacteriales bacterium]|nr:phosphoribosylformylglycinamidine cyclo-ligase [Eubacteriales bacterium]